MTECHVMPLSAADRLDALRRGVLGGARRLSLAGLGLDALPDELLGLADTLEFLDLAGNALRDLPHWVSRLHRLRVLFGSGNRFAALPEVLGSCAALSQVGFRGCGMTQVPEGSLPPNLRWLTLTDNALTALPVSLGARPRLSKLLLAGNRLDTLPDLSGLPTLELVRISANAFEALPGWLPELPQLAWAAWAGNPAEPAIVEPMRHIAWETLATGAVLGEGSSGEVRHATWRAIEEPEPEQAVALKLFKGSVSSDGLASREIDASLAAGLHDGLVGAFAAVAGHPEGRAGLVMRLVPPGWRVLGGPPSLASCTRDVYAADAVFDARQVQAIAGDVGAGAAHLHRAGYAHGDLYAHNVLWDGTEGRAKLGDLGAASRLPEGASALWAAADIRAWAILLEELLDRCPTPWPQARALVDTCRVGRPHDLPPLADAVASLAALSPPG